MYLTRIDPKTGLVDISDLKDGVLAIKEFKKLIDHKDFGLQCFTCIALTIDHETPWGFYDYAERHIKAMRQVMGTSDAFNWGDDLVQIALKKYDELQYHPTITELRLLDAVRHAKIKEVEKTKDLDEKQKLLKKLGEIRTLHQEMKKSMDLNELFNDAPTVNGYSLTRLEQKVENKKSFYHD